MTDTIPWVAIVTGGASGIGEATCHKLASRGIHIAVADVTEERGHRVAEALRLEYGVEAIFVKTDVSQESEVKSLVETVVAKWGRLDYAANVAGICEPVQGEEHSMTVEVFDKTVAINQRGTWLCQKYEAEQMMKQKPRAVDIHPPSPHPIKPQRGSIVNIASTTAMTGFGFPAYAPTKRAVLAITKNGARFYGPHGIRCNSVAPGGTLTPMMLASMPQEWNKSNFQGEGSPATRPIPLGVLAWPQEQANTISFLLSPESSSVNAVNILVDGGWAECRMD